MRRHASLSVALAAAALFAAGCDAPSSREAAAGQDAWREFEGSWSAAGSVHTIAFGSGREATVAELKGSLTLAGPSRPGVGFRGDAIALSDTATGMTGRAVWTDAHGDQIFSELRGGGPSKGSHVNGKFVGGTGAYAGASGEYEFTWQYVIAAEDGTVQGRAVGLKGRVRKEGN